MIAEGDGTTRRRRKGVQLMASGLSVGAAAGGITWIEGRLAVAIGDHDVAVVILLLLLAIGLVNRPGFVGGSNS